MLRGWKDTGRWLSWNCASPIGLYQDLVTSASPTCSVKPDHAFCTSRPPCRPLHIYRSLSIHGALQKRFHSCFAERSLCSEHACVCRFVCIQVGTHVCVWVWVCVWVCLLACSLHLCILMRQWGKILKLETTDGRLQKLGAVGEERRNPPRDKIVKRWSFSSLKTLLKVFISSKEKTNLDANTH